MHNTKKYLHTFNSGFPQIKPRVSCVVHHYCFVFENLIVSSKSLFEILEKFFECLKTRNSILETWFSNLENRNSKLEPRNSILDSRKLRGSRIEFRVETVNLHLSGTVLWKTLIAVMENVYNESSVHSGNISLSKLVVRNAHEIKE